MLKKSFAFLIFALLFSVQAQAKPEFNVKFLTGINALSFSGEYELMPGGLYLGFDDVTIGVGIGLAFMPQLSSQNENALSLGLVADVHKYIKFGIGSRLWREGQGITEFSNENLFFLISLSPK
ncbi:MAG: hypothetical protein ACE5I1_05035 [bacterium]